MTGSEEGRLRRCGLAAHDLGGTTYRGGPKARALVTMDQPIGGEVRLKQQRRATVIYVQGRTGWQMIPPNAQLLDRVISLQPQSNAPQYTTASVEDVDGSRSGYGCAAWPKVSWKDE